MEQEMLKKILETVLETQKTVNELKQRMDKLEQRMDKLEQEFKQFKREMRQEFKQFKREMRQEFEQFRKEMIEWGTNELYPSIIMKIEKMDKKLDNQMSDTAHLEKIKEEILENKIEHHIYKERIHQLEKTDYEMTTDLDKIKEKLLVTA